MPSRSNSSLAALLLTQRLVDTPATPLKASEYWALLKRVGDPASLLGLERSAVAELAGSGDALPERIVQLLGAGASFAFELDRAEQTGLRVVASVDDDYPAALLERLARGAPPLLYVVGDPQLLAGELVGIVGSRSVHPPGAEAAKGIARETAAHGMGVVSGGAKGVDRLAMQASLDGGAPVVCVLADSLTRTVRDPDVRRAVTDGQLCLCTPYKPSAGFSVANAMGRNKIIYGLSRATVVIAADVGRGGTWAGAVEAIRRGIAPVMVWTGDGGGPGNEKLLVLGASPLGAVDELFPLPTPTSPDTAEEPASQLALEV